MFQTTIMLVGVTTGGALLTAQYWGAGDRQGVRESTALTWLVSTLFALLTIVFFVSFPAQIMGVTTDSQEVISLGVEYIVTFSMLAVSCVSSMAAWLTAMHKSG